MTRELDRLLPWQAGHGQATAVIAIHIAQAMGLHDAVLHQLKLAALLHDIGLLMLPVHLQTGRESLDTDSYATIQNHPRLGSILLESFPFLREAAVMITHHHEQWDGSGYPYSLRGEFIPLGARILAVADAFEAIDEIFFAFLLISDDLQRCHEPVYHLNPTLWCTKCRCAQRQWGQAEDSHSRCGHDD